MKKGRLIILLLVLLLLSVVTYLIVQLRKVNSAVWTYAGVKIKSLSFKKIELTAYFRVTNNGMATITLSNQEYDVYLNGKFLSHMKYSQPFTIMPGTNTMPLEVVANLSDILKTGWANLSQILTDKSKLSVNLKGTYSLKIGFLSFNKQGLNQTFSLGSMGQAKS